jgi:hypothetical protein
VMTSTLSVAGGTSIGLCDIPPGSYRAQLYQQAVTGANANAVTPHRLVLRRVNLLPENRALAF